MEKLISQLKAQNKLINIVRCQPKISKTALSEYLKVSWPTVSTNIEALKKSGIFDPDEGLAINGEFAYMVGLSVGSAQIKLSIIDMNFLPISADFFSKLIQDLNLFEEARSYMLEKK